MRGNLIIGRNHAFYNINNDLIKVNINGNFNKVVNPFRIKDVYIHGNNNNVEIIGNGEIKFVKFFGNNNTINIKNDSMCHYEEHGNGNLLNLCYPLTEEQYLDITERIRQLEDECSSSLDEGKRCKIYQLDCSASNIKFLSFAILLLSLLF